jgi:hypothetical protein
MYAKRAASLLLACTLAFAGAAAAENALAPGKDGTRPRIARALPAADVQTTAEYQGIWQNAPAASEPGWAIAFAPDGDSIVATWLTYDSDGSPMWLALEGVDVATLLDGAYAPRRVFAGELYRAFAPAADAGVGLVAYGPAAIEFSTANLATFHYNVDGTWRSKLVERTYAADAPACAAAANVGGLWSDAARRTTDAYAGGVHVAHEGDVVVAAWFGFDAQGKATWRVMSAAPSGPNEYTGTLYRTHGPALDTAFDAARVAVTAAGTGTLAFAADSLGVFSFVVDGAPSAMTLSRRVTTPTASCN